jgi:hypothetical protein
MEFKEPSGGGQRGIEVHIFPFLVLRYKWLAVVYDETKVFFWNLLEGSYGKVSKLLLEMNCITSV